MRAYQVLGYSEGITDLRNRLAEMSGERNPLVVFADAFVASLAGRPGAVVEHLQSLDPSIRNSPQPSAFLAQAYVELGNFEAARTAAERAYPRVFDSEAWTQLPDGRLRDIEALCIGGYILSVTGDPEGGKARMQAGLEYAQNELPRYITGREDSVSAASCSLVLGEVDHVLRTLETLTAGGDLTWVGFFSSSRAPEVEPLRNRTDFQELLAAGQAELERQRERLRALDAEAATPLGEAGP